MSFTPAQQGQFRPLVKRAWQVECNRVSADPKNQEAQRAWYEEQLQLCLKKRTTSGCNRTSDYEKVMAHFEATIGESYTWQLALFNGNKRRILHEVRQIAENFDCEESYMRGIAQQALRTTLPLNLEDLEAPQLITILRALKIQVARQERRGDRTDKPRTTVDRPF